MKGIVITPQYEVTVRDFEKPLYKSTAEVTGGFEIVKPIGLPSPFCMIVDDNGLLKNDIEINPIGSFFYGTHAHGHPIVGTIVIMKMGYTLEGADIVGLSDGDIDRITYQIEDIKSRIQPQEAPHDLS